MAKVVETKTTYSCDRCGLTSENADFSTAYEAGAAKMTIDGHLSSKSCSGDWGGIKVKVAIDLCRDCLVKLREFIDPTNAKRAASGEQK